MKNTEALKRILKAPLKDSNPTEFVDRIFYYGKMVGKKEGYQQGYEAGKEDEHGESRRPFGR